MNLLRDGEKRYCVDILERDRSLREFLTSRELRDPPDPTEWYDYLSSIKLLMGNFNNSVSFVSCLLAKQYLLKHFDLHDYDAGAKLQGAPGVDISVSTKEGGKIVAEIKTTFPYGEKDFGSAQRREFMKDFAKLNNSVARHKFMFVTEEATFQLLKSAKYSIQMHEIRVVNLMTGDEHET